MQDNRNYYFQNNFSNAYSPPVSSSLVHRGNVIVSANQLSSSDTSGKSFSKYECNLHPVSLAQSPITSCCNEERLGVVVAAAEASGNREIVANDHHHYEDDVNLSGLKDCDKDVKEPKTALRKRKNIESFTCQYCLKVFKHKSYFEYHLRTHSGDRPFKCHACPKSFFERSKLNRHLNFCHNIKPAEDIYNDRGDESNTCPKCNKTFRRPSGLQAHLLTHDSVRPFSCAKCDKSFSGRTALKNHEKIAHQGNKDVKCDICGKLFLLAKYLNLHMNTTHKKEQRKFKCTKCFKEFHSSKDLKRHLLLHSNEKNFTCNLCQTSFKRKDNLNRHLKLTHLLAPEQINEQAFEHSDIEIIEDPTSEESLQPSHPPILNQVSVIKSTHEVMMSMSMGRNYL